jgi:hypothetical protein
VLEEAQICTGSFCFVLFLFLRDFPLWLFIASFFFGWCWSLNSGPYTCLGRCSTSWATLASPRTDSLGAVWQCTSALNHECVSDPTAMLLGTYHVDLDSTAWPDDSMGGCLLQNFFLFI